MKLLFGYANDGMLSKKNENRWSSEELDEEEEEEEERERERERRVKRAREERKLS